MFGCLFFVCSGAVFAPTAADAKPGAKDKFDSGRRIETGSDRHNGKVEWIADELVVKYRSNRLNLNTAGGQNRAAGKAQLHGMKKKIRLERLNAELLQLEAGHDLGQKLAELSADPDIEYAEPNYRREPLAIPTNDSHRAELWGLDNTGQAVNGVIGTADADIDWPEAWSVFGDVSVPVVVAVLDTGVAYMHPDLDDVMWDGSGCLDSDGNPLGVCVNGWDYDNADPDPLPTDSTHGTHVAGTIAAEVNNGLGILGVSPTARIMALSFGLTTATEVQAIDFAIQNGARVINASFGGGGFSRLEYEAIERFTQAGGLFVAAAGNGGWDLVGDDNDLTPYYPVGYDLDGVIGVAATDYDDVITDFSNYGQTTVDVGAPGYSVYSTVAGTSVIYSEDFNGISGGQLPAGWARGGDGNNWGALAWDQAREEVLSSQYPSGPYPADSDNSVTGPTIDLSGRENVTLSYRVACDTYYEPVGWEDYLAVEVSDNGADFSVFQLWDEEIIDRYSGDDRPDGYAEYHSLNEPLDSSFLTDSFRMRFHWVSDSANNDGNGCWVDDLVIEAFGDGSSAEYEFMPGTSMATPHVAGLAALLWSYAPNLTAAQVKQAILDTGDSLDSLDSKTVSGRRINAYGALSAFDPQAGTSQAGTVEADRVSQATDGSGEMTVRFRLSDGLVGLPITLSGFQYSLDGGQSWRAPANGDQSEALSAGWQDNSYLSAADFSGPEYEFVFDTDHADVSGFEGSLQETVGFRFSPQDGAAHGVRYAEVTGLAVDGLADVPVLSAPSKPVTVSGSAIDLVGTAEAGSLVRIYDSGDSLVGSQQLAAEDVGFSISVDLVADSANDFEVEAQDPFGNVSERLAAPRVTEDSQPPLISVFSLGGDPTAPYETGDSTPRLIVSGEAGMSCRWSGDDLGYGDMPSGQQLAPAGSFASIDLSDQGMDGQKAVSVSCQDELNNAHAPDTNLDIDFLLDSSLSKTTSASADPDPAPAGTVAVTVTFSDSSQVDDRISPSVTVAGLLGSPYGVTETGFFGNVWSGQFDLPDQDESTVAAISVSGAKDTQGNFLDEVSVAGTFDVDTSEPVAMLSGLPAAVTASRTLQVTVEPGDTAGYRYRLDGQSWSADQDALQPIEISDLVPGPHELEVLAVDRVGNWQAEQSATAHSWTVLSPPTIEPDGGTYDQPAVVVLTSAGASGLFYTLDGSQPTCQGGMPYQPPLKAYEDATLKAVACDSQGQATQPTESVFKVSVVLAGSAMGNLVDDGWVGLLPGEEPESATAATFDYGFSVEVPSDNGVDDLAVPGQTAIVAASGSAFDIGAWAASAVPVEEVEGVSTALTVVAAMEWGVPGVSLEFSQPIGVSIAVGEERDGSQLSAYRSHSKLGGWTVDGLSGSGLCRVASGSCNLSATKASYYIVTENPSIAVAPPTGGGGGGGGVSAAPASVIVPAAAASSALTGADLTPEEASAPAADPSSSESYTPSLALSANPTINVDKRLSPPEGQVPVVPTGSLIKGSGDAVYFYGRDGRRYGFANERVFYSWYEGFDSLIVLTDSQLASIPLGGNVTYRPGARLIKIASDPKVYAVSRGGLLRWVTTEDVATALYGFRWNRLVDDVSVALFLNYEIGDPITDADIEQAVAEGLLVRPVPEPLQPAEVDWVYGGDSFRIDSGETVRLIGLEAPPADDCNGQAATDWAVSRLYGQTVMLSQDYSQAESDPAGRLLRYAELPDGSDFGLKLIAAGWARELTYKAPYDRQAEYQAAEAKAKKSGLGQWGIGCQKATVTFGKR